MRQRQFSCGLGRGCILSLFRSGRSMTSRRNGSSRCSITRRSAWSRWFMVASRRHHQVTPSNEKQCMSSVHHMIHNLIICLRRRNMSVSTVSITSKSPLLSKSSTNRAPRTIDRTKMNSQDVWGFAWTRNKPKSASFCRRGPLRAASNGWINAIG